MKNDRVKIYVLCITCLYSRAINLKISRDLTVDAFIRSFQLHIFDYGCPEKVYSDMGTQIVAAGNLIRDFIKDPETVKYFHSHNMQLLEFHQFPKGCKQLGSLIEICVKMVKRLIHATIKNNIVSYEVFEYLISEAVHLVNKRPISFKEAIRDDSITDVPTVITPEMIIHGFDLPSLNVIPNFQVNPSDDVEWLSECNKIGHSNDMFEKIRKVRANMIQNYNGEFLKTLSDQATNTDGRFKPVTHKKLNVGDIVLLKESLSKPASYPMAVVREIKSNDLGEVVEVVVKKGSTGELLRRHVSVVVPYLTNSIKKDNDENVLPSNDEIITDVHMPERRPQRTAATFAAERNSALFRDNLA